MKAHSGAKTPLHTQPSGGETAAYRKWSADKKRRLGPFAGLSLFQRASDGSLVIASRHWPHLLCWQWALDWRACRAGEGRWWLRYRRSWDGAGWTLHLLCLGRISFDRQNYDWMPALGPHGENAPVGMEAREAGRNEPITPHTGEEK